MFLRGDEEAIGQWMEDLLIAFRLFKPSFFCHGGQWLIATGTLTINGKAKKIAATRTRMSADIPVGSLSATEYGNFCYYLRSSEIGNFCQFRDRIEADLKELRRVPRIRLALDYLMSSYNVRQPANHVVDLFISLEALLKQSPDETSNRLFKRVANLIGRNRVETKEAYETARRYYAVRCAIVHGSVLTMENEAALASVSHLRELVRSVFLVCTALGMKVGFGSEYYAAVDDSGRDWSLKKSVQQDAFRPVAAADVRQHHKQLTNLRNRVAQ